MYRHGFFKIYFVLITRCQFGQPTNKEDEQTPFNPLLKIVQRRLVILLSMDKLFKQRKLFAITYNIQ